MKNGCFFLYKKEILHLNLDDEELNDKLLKFTDGVLNIILIQTKSGKIEPQTPGDGERFGWA